MITFHCQCGKKFRADDDCAGQRAQCDRCHRKFVVPKLSEIDIDQIALTLASSWPSTSPPEPSKQAPTQSASRAALQDPIIRYGAGIPLLFLLVFFGHVVGAGSSREPRRHEFQALASKPAIKSPASVIAPVPLAVGPTKRDSRQSVTVYQSYADAKFHADGCRQLKDGKFPITLFQADEKYEPCDEFWPPKIEARAKSNASAAATAVASIGQSSPAPTSPPRAQSTPTPSYPSSSSIGTTPTGNPLHVGPRGGICHYSKYGNKVYQRHKK